MSKMEKTVDRVYIAGGLVLLATVIMAMSSCGINKSLTNKQIEKRNNIDYELNKLYLEYSNQRDSLITEFYQIKATKSCCERTIEKVYKHEGLYISE